MTSTLPRRTTRVELFDLETDRDDRVRALIGAAPAALLAGAGMLLLRSTLQVRSLPERLMEWLLLFIPPAAFEAALKQLGFDAKRYALLGSVVFMLLLLGLLGYVALRRRWPVWALAAVGVGLWLFVMVVVMPVTSAGLFASNLLDGKRAAIGGYLAVCLTYAAALACARAWLFRQPARVLDNSRRSALGVLGGAATAYVGTYLVALLVPKQLNVATVVLEDPQEPVPSGGLEQPNPHPNVVATPPGEQAAPPPTAQPERPPAARDENALPEPSTSRALNRDKDGAVLPTGRSPGQLTSEITSNTDFYVVTKNAAGDPTIRPTNWRLLVDGEVERSFQLEYATLRRLPAVEVTKTLECISNFVGKPELAPFGAELISTARWKGVPVREILSLVGGPKPGASWVAVLSADEYTSALPLEVIMDPDTLLVYEMNGEVLPREHGYPARLLVPNRYGMKSAKWVVGLRPMRREVVDWYGQRNWTKEGVIQTMTRIDSPARGAVLQPGPSTVAGVAYAGTRGIARVEISTDSESWNEAELLDPPPVGSDRWVRWRASFSVRPKQKLTLQARATDGNGDLQIEAFSLPEPNGGTGWPSIEVQGA